MTDFEALFTEILGANGLDRFISPENATAFGRLTEALVAFNSHTNLTAVDDPRGIIALHYADSLFAAEVIPEGAEVVDVGCGGGFPSLPLAIVRPDITVTALDATAKKLTFVTEAAELLRLKNVSALCGRAEELGRDPAHREKHGVTVARAVAPLGRLLEYCLPLTAPAGKFIAMKGARWATERDEARAALGKLCGKITDVREFTLAGAGEPQKHAVIIVQKTAPTPINYPRNNAQITKKPL